jgi:Peptidase family S41
MAFFPGVNGQRFAREADRAIRSLQDCPRLIVDLRGNLGGFVAALVVPGTNPSLSAKHTSTVMAFSPTG